MVKFLTHKDDAFEVFFFKLYKKVKNEKGCNIISIKSDHGGEFKNDLFQKFCENSNINHNFSTQRTPQQNEVIERKNKSLKEITKIMLNGFNTPKQLWAKAVNTTCYLQNKIYLRLILSKNPYELWNDRKPNISYFHPFGCQCFILNTKYSLGKFVLESDKAIMLDYAKTSKAYKYISLELLR